MHITVIGTGYVGLVTGACFAETGNDVTCLDTDEAKISRLQKGEIPFYEPGLHDLVESNVKEGRLLFSSKTATVLKKSEIAFICVGTPSRADGAADLQYVMSAVDSVIDAGNPSIIAIKSTVPVGTCEEVKNRIESKTKKKIHVVSNPEFLREGSAVSDCLNPDRIIIGTDDAQIAQTFRTLYAPYVRTGKPIFIVDVNSAEMTKYSSNAFLAQRISFMNEISMLCELVGADVSLVRKGMAADHRIGSQYLFPSVGFGGSCFPKDVRALVALAETKGAKPSLLRATLDVNDSQKKRFLEKILKHFGEADKGKNKKVAVWGLSFKAKTDDIRESPALTVIDGLLQAGIQVHAYDPVSMPNTKQVYGNRLLYAEHQYDALKDADALVILTEWNQFRVPDFEKMRELMKSQIIFDGRNLYELEEVQRFGFTYHSIGRTHKAVPKRFG